MKISPNYLEELGALIANLHSLEIVLRMYLSNLPGARPTGLPHGTDMFNLPVGTELMESNS
jgi:hypothetical protein